MKGVASYKIIRKIVLLLMINKQQRIIHVSDIMVDNPNNDKCIQSSDTTFNRNYKSHFNGNRLIFVTFILLTILFDDAHHSVRGDLTGKLLEL